jgi:3'-phosphoadenosine 5'-phosphosulfate sulfotransferase (PAPS reductase)/FAD synthetase
MATLQEAIETIGDPSIRHIVNISGGKDSAALALYLKEKHPELPAEYVFCDTGAELPETYDYLRRLEARLETKLVRIDAMGSGKTRRKAGRNAFDIWLKQHYGGFLPNPRSRWCTRVLKIQPFERYIGDDRAYSYIGIRADEDREGYVSRKPPVLSEQPNIIPVYPFKDGLIRLSGVEQILEDAGLDLPDYYRWRSRSGCYFCFYQQISEWQSLKEEHPDLFEQAKSYEREENGRQFTWVQGRTLDEIAALPRQPLKKKEDGNDGCAICHL